MNESVAFLVSGKPGHLGMIQAIITIILPDKVGMKPVAILGVVIMFEW